MPSMPPHALVKILALGLTASGLLLGFAYDRQGSVELFFSGLGLFLLNDVLSHKSSAYFQEHCRLFQLMLGFFSTGFSVFLLLAAVEFALTPYLRSFQEELLIMDALAATLLTAGVGPYLSWVLKSHN